MAADEFAKLAGPNPEAAAIKQELTDIILWNERSAPRSRQAALGPSELGDPCDRRIAYRIAGIAPVNLWTDPWPAIVGTAIHDWLEKAVNKYQSNVKDLGYLTELRVHPDAMVRGRSDVYNTNRKLVVDHKTTGVDGMRKVHKGIISPGYRTQIHLYGLGHIRAGREVDKVCLVFYPRGGWLDDAYVWIEDYDPAIAQAALKRMYGLAEDLIDLEIEKNPHRFQLIEATPGDTCVWCPFWSKTKDYDVAADATGCPGR